MNIVRTTRKREMTRKLEAFVYDSDPSSSTGYRVRDIGYSTVSHVNANELSLSYISGVNNKGEWHYRLKHSRVVMSPYHKVSYYAPTGIAEHRVLYEGISRTKGKSGESLPLKGAFRATIPRHGLSAAWIYPSIAVTPHNLNLDYTELLSRLNTAEFDVTTNLGELRESLSMFHDMLSAIRHPIRQLGEVSRKILSDPLGSVYQIGDYAANLRLMYRYGILPIMLQLKTLLESQKRAKLVHKTHRVIPMDALSERMLESVQKTRVNETVEGIQFYSELDYTLEIKASQYLRRIYTVEQLIDRFFQFDLMQTGWELTKLSFVVDWAIQVGDFLAARGGPDFIDQKGCVSFNAYLALKAQDFKTEEHTRGKPSMLYPGAEIFNAHVKGYLREAEFHMFHRVTNNIPADYVKLNADIEFGIRRQLDAIALLWRPLSKGLKRDLQDYRRVEQGLRRMSSSIRLNKL